ncbi:MAG: hypothetical protein Q7T50_00920 [Candidatus Magasanikbacteria bacterium]|nr:hypothetical protein [Candidatus Magasanikbacteria bacterium]
MESTITAKLATSSSNILAKYQYLSLNYWFGTPDQLGFGSLVPLEIVSTLIFIIAFFLVAVKLTKKGLTPPDQKYYNRAIWLTLFFGPVGWLLIVFRNLGVVFLSARFWWLIWFGMLFWVIYYLVRYYQKVLPQAKINHASYQLKKRYFPKKKKR